MKTLSEYRAEARVALKGNWMSSVMLVFVYVVISFILSGVTSIYLKDNEALSGGGSLICTLLILPMGFGLAFAFLGQFRNREMQISDLFCGYNLRVWGTLILQYIYTVLWCLLLIIPGIIKSYSYAMTSYIMVDNPELSGNAAIEKSMQMMQGHKMRLFLLDLTFIGWYILGFICFGIGILWAEAYNKQTRAAFYETLKVEEAID